MAPSLFLAALILLLAQATLAQTTISGIVQDELTGEPLAGAAVLMTELDRSTVAGEDGRYLLRDVPAGTQVLTFRFIGHAPRTLQALVPSSGELEINVSLRPEPLQLPTVEVRTRAIVRGTESELVEYPDRASSITAVWNHPLLAEPDVLQAMSGGEVVLKPESPSGIHIRGGSSDQTAFLLDGIPIFSPYHTAGVFSAWNPDALSRVHLSSSGRSLSHPHALSGTVEAITRAPSDHFRAQGSASTTQARVTVDGPFGIGGVGYQVSLRSGFPSLFVDEGDPSFLDGKTTDEIVKIEAPTFGGRARLLFYGSGNSVNTATAANAETTAVRDLRNTFEWDTRSWGGEWGRVVGVLDVRAVAWIAEAEANSGWGFPGQREDMENDRRDVGGLASLEHQSRHTTTRAGFRFENIKTSYSVESDSAIAAWDAGAKTPVATVFAQHSRALSSRFEIEAGLALASFSGDLYPGPRAQVRSKSSEKVVFSATYARTHQYAQSFRNPESVAGNVFPVDLFMGAGASGVPVAESDQGIVAIEYRPRDAFRLAAQAYGRSFRDLLLIAPVEGEPFSRGSFSVGEGTSRGISLDAAMSTTHFGVVTSYGLQRVRLERSQDDDGYVPDHGSTHQLEGGVIHFPSPSFSVRIGASALLGRRATPLQGGFEWEANNLLDQGSEFAGSPVSETDALGSLSLPTYFRVDLGVRKTWTIGAGSRDVRLSLFGTVTNIFGRKNVLNYAKDPVTGTLTEIEMRPLAPLVLGLDWRF